MIHPKRFGAALALTAGAFLCALHPAHAQTTVFSSFGPGNTFNAGAGFYESVNDSQGAEFTVSTSGQLASVTVAVSNISGTNGAHFYLTDSAANLGNTGAALESFTFTHLTPLGTSFTPLVSLSSQHPFLTTGQTYYLYEYETGDSVNAFDLNTAGVSGTSWSSIDGGAYTSGTGSDFPAFSVQIAAAAVPEPSTLAVLAVAGLGLGLLMFKSRTRKTA
ncbi:hypothetical protein CCAX7_20290 [Capsulimonas corticalis]|uniref:Ice-binding protein C-terminal domain-containing protein n=2 Tax=Capsulimonas corticalis TaxID=2219043 RepID=A0A402D2E2_9BACT|nr:hypothetical protein CCAX7_20290 [Capsulimonas corticalis]